MKSEHFIRNAEAFVEALQKEINRPDKPCSEQTRIKANATIEAINRIIREGNK